MYHLSSCVLGGVVAAVAIMPFAGDPDRPLATPLEQRAAVASWPPASAGLLVNRACKGDRLGDRRNDAALHHDRDGSVQLGTDPTGGVTIVAKDSILPDVAVRNPAASAAKPVTLEAPRKSRKRATSPLPDGCESSVSSISDRSLANVPGRCVT